MSTQNPLTALHMLTIRNTNKTPEGIALRLRRNFDSDEKYEKRSNEYQNYLIGRNYSHH